MISPQFWHSHTGIGVAKYLCLEITQSHSREFTHSSNLFFMNSGYHFISLLVLSTRSLNGSVFKNHCFVNINSTGVLHLQHTPTFCFRGSFFMRYPSLSKSSIIFFLASSIFKPLYFPHISVILPSSSMHISIGSLYLKTHFRSSLSPIVHIITIPVPKLGSTDSSSTIFTSLSKNGTFRI